MPGGPGGAGAGGGDPERLAAAQETQQWVQEGQGMKRKQEVSPGGGHWKSTWWQSWRWVGGWQTPSSSSLQQPPDPMPPTPPVPVVPTGKARGPSEGPPPEPVAPKQAEKDQKGSPSQEQLAKGSPSQEDQTSKGKFAKGSPSQEKEEGE